MKSFTTAKFRKAFDNLPKSIQDKAVSAYELWLKNPRHPSLHFKKIKSTKHTYSVRIDIDYWAVGARKGDTIIWFWIGTHNEYETMIQKL